MGSIWMKEVEFKAKKLFGDRWVKGTAGLRGVIITDENPMSSRGYKENLIFYEEIEELIEVGDVKENARN